MRLETAMNTSKEGIFVHGQAISVVGDNISNTSTTGYKTSRAEFKDMLAACGTPTGGMMMSGCGATLQDVRTLYDTGTIENTGRSLDLAIAGDGFFLVGDPANPYLTRAGNFQISQDGYLETANGDKVLGFSGKEGTELGPINMLDANLNGEATTNVSLAGNLCSTSAITTVPPTYESFADLQASASFSSSMEVYDSLGASHTVSYYYYKTDSSTWQVQAYVDSGDTGGTPGKPQLIGETTLTFDGYGQLTETSANSITANVTFSEAAPSNITIDLSGMMQYATNSGMSNVTLNGQAAGNIVGYTFTKDGTILAELSSGRSTQIGTLQIGNVRNVDGLERDGNGLFKITSKAGELTIATPGGDSFGEIEGSSLELSTVDISNEFVNLIVFQRAYQANSSVLSQVSSLLQETISLIR